MDDAINIVIDVIFDFSFSTISYYYNPFSNKITETAVNALFDGVIDYAEQKVFFSQKATQSNSKNVEILTFKEQRL